MLTEQKYLAMVDKKGSQVQLLKLTQEKKFSVLSPSPIDHRRDKNSASIWDNMKNSSTVMH